MARPKGFEPLTSGLEIHRSSTELRAQMLEVTGDLARFAQVHKPRMARSLPAMRGHGVAGVPSKEPSGEGSVAASTTERAPLK